MAEGQSKIELAASSGEYRKGLEALRDRLAAGVAAADDRRLVHLAPLAKQLADVLKEIESLPAVEGASRSDELRAARAARIAKASGL